MTASEAKLLDFLKKSPQFVILIYQRLSWRVWSKWTGVPSFALCSSGPADSATWSLECCPTLSGVEWHRGAQPANLARRISRCVEAPSVFRFAQRVT